jgi:hypothetical protein
MGVWEYGSMGVRVNIQLSTAIRQPPTANRHPPTANRQPSTAIRQRYSPKYVCNKKPRRQV